MNAWLLWALFVNCLIAAISTRGASIPPSSTPDLPRVEQGWVVSVGADTSQAVTADTTHNSPPVFSWFAGGATEPRVADYPSLPGDTRHHFRVG